MKKNYSLLICLFTLSNLFAGSGPIILHAKSATVWLPQQTISGELNNISAKKIIVHINDSSFSVSVKNQQFIFSVLLKQKQNLIWAEISISNQHINSDTILFELGYKPLPQASPFATAKNNKVSLQANITSNPYKTPLYFLWKDDKRNPKPVKITNNKNSTAQVVLPSVKGDYYFNLFVIAGNDTAKFQTIINRSDSIHCFNINKDHSAWIDSCIMYEITPYVFVQNANYDDIAKKLPELKTLGINTIWLQPLCKTHNGEQGYDITDYFSLRPDLGSEEQLQHLIAVAKSLNLRVLFDVVLNHTSVFHPYAQNSVLNNADSHYYNFFQHDNDGAKYSSLYYKDRLGFYHYFWNQLINLNYLNPEVAQWMIEACKYWLQKFDLDGFRFDAMWALNARAPLFGRQLQQQLKSIKPDILLLAEDKGANSSVYKEGFDAAFDWETDTNWISHWSWQYDYDAHDNLTIFNFKNENKRGDMLRKALFNNGDSTHIRLRFMENNDLPRFINAHDLQRTKMVATLLFSLPGIPLIFNGQEINRSYDLNSTKPIFKADQSIKSLDKDSVFTLYLQLAHLRAKHDGLRSSDISNLEINHPGSVVALRRSSNNETFIIVINMSASAQQVSVDLQNVINEKGTSFTDVITNEIFSASAQKLNINMNGYSTRMLLLNDSVAIAEMNGLH